MKEKKIMSFFICGLLSLSFLKIRVIISLDSNVIVSDPIIVGQDNEYKGWGYFQFPKLYYSGENIICKVANKPDSAGSYTGEYLFFRSSDGGCNWYTVNSGIEPPDYSLLMRNGRYFQGAVFENEYISGIEENYKSEYNDGSVSLFYASDISESDFSKSVVCEEYDPVKGQMISFTSRFNWPYMPVIVKDGLTVPLGTCMYHYRMHNSGIILNEEGGNLLMAVYSRGFNSETGDISYGSHYNIYFFRSNDNARTWNYVSQILTEDNLCEEEKDGLCEPCLIEAQSGGYVVLMRSGSDSPSYISYSEDKGTTWSKPSKFDSCGVDPQLLRLKNGVTIASYGRPGVYVRLTVDSDCRKWNAPMKVDNKFFIKKSKWGKYSCSYTSLLPINEDEALLVYSDFQYPSLQNPEEKVRTILVRKIKIEINQH